MRALEQMIPEGYKQTEVGVIPNDWNIKKLGDVCSKVQDGNYGAFYPKSSEFIDFGIPFLTSKVLGKTGSINSNKIDFISNKKHQQLTKAHLMLNDVLFTNRGASVGAIGFVDESIADGNIGPQLTLLRSSALIKPRYLYHIMKSFWVQNQVQGQDSGSAMNFFGIGTTLKFKFPVPHTSEQTAIANALSDVDALLTALENLIAKTQAIKTATMQQLLTGKTRLPQFATHTDGEKKGQPKDTKPSELGEIPEDWDVVTLDEAANFLDGQRRPIKSGDRARIKGQYPYYGASGIVDYVNDFIFDGEFILLGEDGENILSRSLPLAFKASGKIWVNNHAHVMTPKKSYHIDYLIPYLESLDYSLLNSGTAQPKLNKQSCLNIKVIKPSIEEQTAIATILSDMDNEIQTLEHRLKKTRQIKQGMMQELLTGKTRLPF
jgi:type I restriction enzyme S subunit